MIDGVSDSFEYAKTATIIESTPITCLLLIDAKNYEREVLMLWGNSDFSKCKDLCELT